MERVRSQTRVMMITNALLAFSAPTSGMGGGYYQERGLWPELTAALGTDLKDIKAPEFVKLMTTMDYGEALSTFMAANPDGNAWTVFRSENLTGSPLSVAAEAGEWMEENGDFLSAHPTAGAWFVPFHPSVNDDFSLRTYTEQFAQGWRQLKDPDDFYDDLKIQGAAQDYYAVKGDFDRALELAADDPDERRELRAAWKSWKEGYFHRNPLFRDAQTSSERRSRRTHQIREIGQAFEKNELPRNAWTEAIRSLYSLHVQYETLSGQLPSDQRKVTIEARDALKASYLERARQLTKNNARLRNLFESVFAPVSGIDIDAP